MKLKTGFTVILFMLSCLTLYAQDTVITKNPKNTILCKILSVDKENASVIFLTGNTTNTYSITDLEYCSNSQVEKQITKNKVTSGNSLEIDSIGFRKGNVLIGGNFSLSTETSPPSITVLPEIVCFTSNDFALTFGLGYTQKRVDSNSSSTFDINIGVRDYVLRVSKRCRIFTSYSFADSIGTSQSAFNITFNAGFGLDYFITPKLVVDFRLMDFFSYSFISESGNTSSQLKLLFNNYTNIFSSPSLGLIYKL